MYLMFVALNFAFPWLIVEVEKMFEEKKVDFPSLAPQPLDHVLVPLDVIGADLFGSVISNIRLNLCVCQLKLHQVVLKLVCC